MYNNENKLVLMTDTIEAFDSLNVGDTLFSELLFNYHITGFYDAWGDEFIENLRLPQGAYNIVVKFYDTLYNYIGDSATKSISVKNEYLPALLYPSDNSQLFDSTINGTIFKWIAPKNYLSTVYYKFRLFQIDSSQLETLENGFENNLTLYEEITTSTNIVLPIDLNTMLDSNKWYAWSIKAYKNSSRSETFIDNKGIAFPFVFSKSRSKRADNNMCCDGNIEGYEDGTMNNWIGTAGKKKMVSSLFKILYPYGRYSWSNSNSLRNHFSLVSTPSVDPLVNIPKVPDGGGKNALFLGSSSSSGDADKITRTFTVTECNKFIKMRYSFILDDGGHNNSNSATFLVRVFKGRNNGLLDNLDEPFVKFADVHDPVFKSIGNITFRVWDCKQIDLSKFIGETVTIEIIVTDCSFDLHFGYAYLDFCGNTAPVVDFNIDEIFCSTQINDITADGTISKNLIHWVWSIQSTDNLGNSRGQEISTDWQHGKGAETINLGNLIKSTGFTCGKFRIKLAGNNECSSWTEKVKIITIVCPANDLAGPEKCCPNSSCNILLGKTAIPGVTYEWLPNNCLFYTNTIARPSFIPNMCGYINYPVMYVLKVTDQNNCFSYDTTYIYNSVPNIQSIIQDSSNGCDLNLHFLGQNFASVEWSWKAPGSNFTIKETGKSITFPSYTEDVIVTFKLKNACGTVFQNFTVKKRSSKSSYNNLKLIFPSIMNLNSTVEENRLLRITEFGFNFGTPNAYWGATDAKLEILNSNGGIVKVWEYNNTSFDNGQLYWDGKVNGVNLPQGVYQWRISLKNTCNNKWNYNFMVWRNYECRKYKRYWFKNGAITYKKCIDGVNIYTVTQWNEITID